jgi:hypothetical protein
MISELNGWFKFGPHWVNAALRFLPGIAAINEHKETTEIVLTCGQKFKVSLPTQTVVERLNTTIMQQRAAPMQTNVQPAPSEPEVPYTLEKNQNRQQQQTEASREMDRQLAARNAGLGLGNNADRSWMAARAQEAQERASAQPLNKPQ